MYCATYKTDKPPVLSVREGVVQLRRGSAKQCAFAYANRDDILSEKMRFFCHKLGAGVYQGCFTVPGENLTRAVGLGDIIHGALERIGVHRLLKRAGIKNCGCQKRREALNKIKV